MLSELTTGVETFGTLHALIWQHDDNTYEVVRLEDNAGDSLALFSEYMTEDQLAKVVAYCYGFMNLEDIVDEDWDVDY